MTSGINTSISLALDFASKRYEEEFKRTEGLNNRCYSLIGYASTLGTLYFGLIARSINKSIALEVVSFFVLTIEFIVIILCLLASNWLLLRKYTSGPGGKILYKASMELSEEELKKKLLKSYTNAYDSNHRRNLYSSQTLRWAIVLSFLGFLLGLTGILIVYIKKI